MYQRKVFERYFGEKEERQLMNCVLGAGGLPGVPGVLARRDAAWMALLRQTGIRVTPLCRLTVADAQQALARNQLLIRGVTNKRGREYQVPLNRKAAHALRALLKLRAELGAGHDCDAPLLVSREHGGRVRASVHDEDQAVCVAFGTGMSVRAVQQRMRMWCDRAGLPGGSPHWMRHTLAKRMLARSTARNPLGIIAGVLGHGSITSTDCYTQPDKEEIEAAMEVAA